jgi:VWFA-related protein
VTAVVVDAVVRDRRGNPVMDLRKEDFELFEDGVRQTITDVTVIRVAEPQEVKRVGASRTDAAGVRSTPSFTAIVFDRLSPEVRAQVARAAHALVDTLHEDDFAGVFLVDQTLRVVQDYTTDRAALRSALERISVSATGMPELNATPVGEPRIARREGRSQAKTVEEAETNQEFQDFAINALRVGQATRDQWESLAAQQQGYATTGALTAIARGLGLLPGRKSVALFAHGLPVPDEVFRFYRQMIGEANRHNVTVYSIDASGLRVHSNEAETQMRLHGSFAGIGEPTRESGMESGVANAMRTPRTNLLVLSRDTGGFFTENTNDLARAAARVAEDRRFHYLLSYTPTNTNFDGNWRTLTLRVPGRRGVEVRARSGYLATPAPTSVTFLEYEGPALAALDRSPAPADVPLRARALVFPEGETSRIAVLAATDAAALQFDRNEAGGTYRTDFSILARIVDSDEQVVRKSSEPYQLTGPAAEMEARRRGTVLFFRQPTLEPGRYTLEVVVHDALARRSGVQRVPFDVPPSAALAVSSLVVVQRAEPATPADREGNNPLRIGDVVVYPNLGEPLRKLRDQVVTFLVVAHAQGAVPPANLEVLQEGQPIAKAPMPLPAPDASGRIEHIAQVPLAAFAPGRYTLRLTVGEGTQRQVREAAFDVVD